MRYRGHLRPYRPLHRRTNNLRMHRCSLMPGQLRFCLVGTLQQFPCTLRIARKSWDDDRTRCSCSR